MGIVETALRILFVGMGATLIMDVSGFIQARVLGLASLDYGLVGRWLGHMLQGRFRHASIMAAPPIRNERLMGWVFHYITGIVFAMVLIGAKGPAWICNPTLVAALVMGLVSVIAPFFIMQPALGFGVAGSKTGAPSVARRRSVTAHLTFGLGLFVAASLLMMLFPTSSCLS
ncbi:DUF2938 domain-containing protein [Pseudomonas sp. O64]|uniref:DUF2938 domain-containing protein n=1 Tax=Pseudomonas TaxID=286 RepID=UPI000BA0DD62|nr:MULTISPECIES: DUF2938 domain-containing protein [unclassified Pseudomonas]MCV2229281.1 DUF2938 domain-containing protein [Pseudomonas sp. AU10]OZO01909.1 hypothetical protein B7453_24515 [Pseudomonas sp. IB20]UXZ24429.1 DUF2938 domain-containing protein [Pseudomonas sp. YeP6b]